MLVQKTDNYLSMLKVLSSHTKLPDPLKHIQQATTRSWEASHWVPACTLAQARAQHSHKIVKICARYVGSLARNVMQVAHSEPADNISIWASLWPPTSASSCLVESVSAVENCNCQLLSIHTGCNQAVHTNAVSQDAALLLWSMACSIKV